MNSVNLKRLAAECIGTFALVFIGCGTRATNPCRRMPTSGSLLSEPSTEKLFDRARMPFTENCPAVPIPNPTPGPRTPGVYGGGATPGARSANSSKLRIAVAPPTGSELS